MGITQVRTGQDGGKMRITRAGGGEAHHPRPAQGEQEGVRVGSGEHEEVERNDEQLVDRQRRHHSDGEHAQGTYGLGQVTGTQQSHGDETGHSHWGRPGRGRRSFFDHRQTRGAGIACW